MTAYQVCLLIGIVVVPILIGGCARTTVRHTRPPKPSVKIYERKALPRLGYTIQAGAFANAENAARLTHSLQTKGLDATYFAARRGLFKVRFGNFPRKDEARARAEALLNAGIIEEFYIVSPGEYAVAKREMLGEDYLREQLLRGARSFLGVPYLWGGTSAESGFDCSGLTMTVYRLIGFDLPRTSYDQFASGIPVDRSSLEKGDLVFFAKKGGRVSHVGIYTGNGQFIHAPGQGKKIRTDSLSKNYFRRNYVGARSYL